VSQSVEASDVAQLILSRYACFQIVRSMVANHYQRRIANDEDRLRARLHVILAKHRLVNK